MSNIVDDQITFLKNSIAEQSNQLQALEDNIKTEDIKTEDIKTEDTIETIDSSTMFDNITNDQDLIWQRMQAARTNMNNMTNMEFKVDQQSCELNNASVGRMMFSQKNITNPVEIFQPTDQPTIESTNDPDATSTNEPVKSEFVSNKLSNFNAKKQNEILQNMYNKASENIKKLALLDESIAENLNDHINIEADRLLNVYLE